MVRGPHNLMMHLMLRMLALFTDQLLKETGC